MWHLYYAGVVQDAVERLYAVASKLDDNGELDVWIFAGDSARATSVTESNVNQYLKQALSMSKGWWKSLSSYRVSGKTLGFGNHEPAVMRDVVEKYTVE